MRNFSSVYANALLFSALPLLAGCTVDRLADGVAGNTVIEAVVAPADDAATRTAVDPTDYASGEIGINWLPSDRIGVYGDKGTANALFSNTSSSESARTTFAGNLADGETARYAYYPYTSTAGGDQTAVKGSLPTTQKYSTATRELEGDWKVGKHIADGRFQFEHVFAFLKFEVNGGGTSISGERLQSVSLQIPETQLGGDFTLNLVNGSYSPTAASDKDMVTMEWSDTPALDGNTHNGYMTVFPAEGIEDKEAEIVVTTDFHIATFKVNLTADRMEANAYYILPLQLSNFADKWTVKENPNPPAAAWVPGLESRLACANTVFAIPGKPFMHKIRVPESTSQTAHAVVPVKTGVKRVWGLPEGLQWNAERCLVYGTAPAAGEYTYSVEFEIGGVTYKEGIHLTVSDSLNSPTPTMGWQSWNVLETKIDEASLKAIADALKSNGYADAGYVWLGIDDCWQDLNGTRDANGVPLVSSSKFPNGIKAVTDYIHSKGLKAGIYSDAGTLTCASGGQAGGTTLGAYGCEAATAKAFTEWGFDRLKEDWFWGGHGDNNGALDPNSNSLAHELYGRMGSGIKAAGNRIVLSMCEWGIHNPWKWGPEVGASSWRMSYDHRDAWWGTLSGRKNSPTKNDGGIGLRNTIDLMRYLWPYSGINSYNDADMLVVGIRGGGTSSNDLVYQKGKMGDAEYETEFAMWCMWSSPLLLTLDVRKTDINSHDKALLLNEELIAINQDPLCQGAEYVKKDGNLEYYMKDLANGDVAIAVVNLGDSSGNYTISIGDYEALDASASYSARDLLAKSDVGTLASGSPLKGSLASHGTFIIRLHKQ